MGGIGNRIYPYKTIIPTDDISKIWYNWKIFFLES